VCRARDETGGASALGNRCRPRPPAVRTIAPILRRPTGAPRPDPRVPEGAPTTASHPRYRRAQDARHVQGRLLVTEPETAKSGASADPGPAKRLLRDLRAAQDDERRRAGSACQETGFVFTTEVGGPYDPRDALRALPVAAGRAGSPREPGCLGHSSASVILGHGVPLMVVHGFLGHSSTAITGAVHGTSRRRLPRRHGRPGCRLR
jgi:hypothetical protein